VSTVAGNDDPQLEFGPRGENISYRVADRTAVIAFTWTDGPRIYASSIRGWTDGAAMTDAEKSRVFGDVIALATRVHERPAVVIDPDDPVREWWEAECGRRRAEIFQIEYASNPERDELQVEHVEAAAPEAPERPEPPAPSGPVTKIRDKPGLWWLLAILFIGAGGAFVYLGLARSGDLPSWQFALAIGMGLAAVATGLWWAWQSPLSRIAIHHGGEYVQLTQFGLFGRRRQRTAFSEIHDVIVERESDNDGAMVVRPVLLLRDGRRVPLSALWRHDPKGIATVVATIRAAIRRPEADA
jgi:hypothetical protein